MVKVYKDTGRSSVYSVFRDGPVYVGCVYAVSPRQWASVLDAENNWLASVSGPDKIQFGADVLDALTA